MKSGIDWFPLDVSLDEKFELIEAEFGLKGFAVIVKLFQRIYGQQGYYCEWTNEVALLFGRSCGLGGNVVSEIVSAAIRRGMFDHTLYDRYHILTSKGIQERYFDAVSRRKSVDVKKGYLLIPYAKISGNANIIEENADISGENAYIFEERREEKSRVEKSRVEKSRVEESRGEEAAPPPPSQESLVKKYGQALVDAYIAKAQRYRKTGTQAVLCAAQWLAEDEAAGKFAKNASKSAIPSGETSMNIDEYERRLESYVPVYRKETQNE